MTRDVYSASTARDENIDPHIPLPKVTSQQKAGKEPTQERSPLEAVAKLREDSDEAFAKLDEVRLQCRDARLEMDRAIVARDDALKQQSLLRVERNEALVQRDESRLHLRRSIAAMDKASLQHKELSAERDKYFAERNEARLQLEEARAERDAAVAERKDVLHHQVATRAVYSITDVDGQRTIHVACPGADRKDIEVLAVPNGVDIRIKGIEENSPSGLPPRPHFCREFSFDHKTEGIFSCSKCSLRDGILTVVLKRTFPQRMPVHGGKKEPPSQRGMLEGMQGPEQSSRASPSLSSSGLENGVPSADSSEVRSMSPASSMRMTYSRQPGAAVAEIDHGDGVADNASTKSSENGWNWSN